MVVFPDRDPMKKSWIANAGAVPESQTAGREDAPGRTRAKSVVKRESMLGGRQRYGKVY